MQKKKEQIDLDEFLKKEVSINKHYYIKKMQEHIKQKFMEKLQTEHVCAEWAQMIYFINAQSRRFLQAYQSARLFYIKRQKAYFRTKVYYRKYRKHLLMEGNDPSQRALSLLKHTLLLFGRQIRTKVKRNKNKSLSQCLRLFGAYWHNVTYFTRTKDVLKRLQESMNALIQKKRKFREIYNRQFTQWFPQLIKDYSLKQDSRPSEDTYRSTQSSHLLQNLKLLLTSRLQFSQFIVKLVKQYMRVEWQKWNQSMIKYRAFVKEQKVKQVACLVQKPQLYRVPKLEYAEPTIFRLLDEETVQI